MSSWADGCDPLSCTRKVSTAKKRNQRAAAAAFCGQKSRETMEHKAGFVRRGCLQLANNQKAHRSRLGGRLTQSRAAERLVKQQRRAGDQGDLRSRARRPAFLCNEDTLRALFRELKYSFQPTRRCRHSSKKSEHTTFCGDATVPVG